MQRSWPVTRAVRVATRRTHPEGSPAWAGTCGAADMSDLLVHSRRPGSHSDQSPAIEKPKDVACDPHGPCRDLWITEGVRGGCGQFAHARVAAEPDRAAHLIGMSTKRPRLQLATKTAPSGLLSATCANPERAAWAHALRSSNAAVPHRNRRREHARGVVKGGRAGAKLAARREADVR